MLSVSGGLVTPAIAVNAAPMAKRYARHMHAVKRHAPSSFHARMALYVSAQVNRSAAGYVCPSQTPQRCASTTQAVQKATFVTMPRGAGVHRLRCALKAAPQCLTARPTKCASPMVDARLWPVTETPHVLRSSPATMARVCALNATLRPPVRRAIASTTSATKSPAFARFCLRDRPKAPEDR